MRISDWGSVVCSSDLQRHRDLAERRCRQCAQQQNPECAMNAVELPVSFDDVRRAANVVDGQLVRTPCTHSRVLSKITGAEVWIKFENFQFTASFKERGDRKSTRLNSSH